MLTIVAAAEAAEHSKTLFYVVGGVLAAWAVGLTVFGMARAEFPASDSASRGVIAISALLVAATLAASIITA